MSTVANQCPVLPADLAAVALVDSKTSAAVGGMSESWWLEQVREMRAPAPVIRQTRCTRWRLVDVRAFWERRARDGAADLESSSRVIAQARKASQSAKSARLAPAQ